MLGKILPNTAPIGIFDSGVGGLTVARAILDQLPNESIIYIGDSASGPYGQLQIADIRQKAIKIMDTLLSYGVKAIVIACNSASAAVLRDAREKYTSQYNIPIIEVIHPAVRHAIRVTKKNRIGIIGTTATIRSKAYEDAFTAAPHIEIFTQPCPRFVEFVELGITAGAELHLVASQYLHKLQQKKIDTLILGCTHYPLLAGVISYVMGPEVTLVSSAEETAKEVYATLVSHQKENSQQSTAQHQFFTTGNKETFKNLTNRFLGLEMLQVDNLTIKFI